MILSNDPVVLFGPGGGGGDVYKVFLTIVFAMGFGSVFTRLS